MARDGLDDPVRPLIGVVNDDSGLRHALGFALGVEGFAVRTFATGHDLLDLSEPPALACLVTDARLPDMSGLDLVARLRRRGDRLPAILISSNPTRRLRREADAAGVTVIEQPLAGDSVVDGVVAVLAALSGTDPRPQGRRA
ncbi:MAG: response regulator [Rhodovulum sp.]|nr:response regulator [Rhodovulum sp.]